MRSCALFLPHVQRSHARRQAGKYVKSLCEWRQLRLQKKNAVSPSGAWGIKKHQGGQTAMKSLMLPASVEIGPANCPNPEQVLIPPKRGDTAKASPNVKWHLLNTRRGECFHVSVPSDLCGPSRNAKPGAAVFLPVLVASSSSCWFWRRSRFPVIPRRPARVSGTPRERTKRPITRTRLTAMINKAIRRHNTSGRSIQLFQRDVSCHTLRTWEDLGANHI